MYLLPVLYLIAKICVCNGTVQLMKCLESDRDALIEFKNGLDDPENRLSLWQGSNCCQWSAISCDNSTGAVVAVDFHNPPPFYSNSSGRYVLWNLSGEVRPSLLKLKSLRHLDLSFNTFNGIPIPVFLGSLENLQYLNLSHAGFSGTIPPNLGNLSSLEYLDVISHSNLVADNLEWMAGLVSLKHLMMSGVDLSMVGSHWVATLNKLPSLTELYLSSCCLSGDIPSFSFVNFTSLAVINLGYNNLNLKIFDWLVNISTLEFVDIRVNQLYGRIPLGFGELPNLQVLSLGMNGLLRGSCFKLFRKGWKKIESLDLSKNHLSGELPASIGKLCNLKYLDLSSNNLEGTLPESLEGIENCLSTSPLPSLHYLELSHNQLHGKLPDWLGQLANLVHLGLAF
jgi:Leucine-rich repeat (LRR) protein